MFLLWNHTLHHPCYSSEKQHCICISLIITVLCCLDTVHFKFNVFFAGILLANSNPTVLHIMHTRKTFVIICNLWPTMEKEQCNFLRQAFICSAILKLYQNIQDIPVPRQRHVDWSRTEFVHWQCWYRVVQKNFFWNSQSQRYQEFQCSNHHHFHCKD